MIKLSICNMQGKSVGDVSLDDSWVVEGRGTQAVHDAVVAYQANRRAGSASTLTKGEVAGHGMKPWKQKGTGRARAGYRQSPVWRGGGASTSLPTRSAASGRRSSRTAPCPPRLVPIGISTWWTMCAR